ncbi:MAG: site-specific DNA-methyltransferase [Dehalococcoidales bacterium]
MSEKSTVLNHTQGNIVLSSTHHLKIGDSRDMSFLGDNSIHLIVTSPPYWNLKTYPNGEKQLGNINDYQTFLGELNKVLHECYRVLVPGGRLVCVVGDVCLSRSKHERHRVMPLHADIAVLCRFIGFDNLNPIIWYKITNASFEVNNGTKFLGKPYEPNAIIKNDIEYILMQRKPGGYRKPSEEQRHLSKLSKAEYDAWFRQIWTIPGASTRKHPAPYPLDLAYRLVRMFSFSGDTVLDPFVGTGTTMVAALRAGRNSLGIDIEPMYIDMAKTWLQEEASSFLSNASITCDSLG